MQAAGKFLRRVYGDDDRSAAEGSVVQFNHAPISKAFVKQIARVLPGSGLLQGVEKFPPPPHRWRGKRRCSS